MNNSFKYICDCCGIEHQQWPALARTSPDYYNELSETEKENLATIDSNTCTINYTDQTNRFIRCVLIQKVNDYCEDLHYGLWISLSEKSYQNYIENFDNEKHETQYFGWLCNNLKEYDSTVDIPTTIRVTIGNNRPEIFPHDDFDHPFVRDYYQGITKAEAEKRINTMILSIDKTA